MTHRNDQRRTGRGHDDFDEAGDAGSATGLWNLVHSRLNGRWKRAVLLGVLLGVLGAVVGYQASAVRFESTGIIHVAPKTDHIVKEIPETGLVPLYPRFMQTQATLISSQRVLTHAIESLGIDALPWDDPETALQRFRARLSAESDDDSELIHVSFAHESPHVAQRVVNAVIESYAKLYATSDGDSIEQRLAKLHDLRERLRQRRAERQAEIQQVIATSEFAASDLEELINHKAMQLQSLSADIRQLQQIIAMTPQRGIGESSDDPAIDPVTGTQVDYRDVEAFDQELQRLGQLRDQARSQFAHARERFTPRHRGYQAAEENLRIAEQLYTDRLRVATEEFLESERLAMSSWAMDPQQQLVHVQQAYEEERQTLRDMRNTQLTLAELNDELETIETDLDETNARIRGLDVEAESIGRITIASLGELPTQPSQDRRQAMAVMGGFGGLLGGIGFFFLLATLDQRVYGVNQLGEAAAGQQMLGVLPALPAGNRREVPAVAAHCVHQIRNRIEASRRPGRSAVLAVSSPYQGDGKTSLTLALAASYAASGYRTLLVDCDIIGQSLSSNLAPKCEHGLFESLAGDDVQQFIVPLQMANLSVLPMGDDPAYGPENIRKADLETLFKKLRQMFDVVLVDTGPLMGSVESLPVAGAADGVVLTMWRGRRQSRLLDCIEALDNANASYIGVVLNCAVPADCARYMSQSKSSALASIPEGTTTNGRSNGERNGSRNALLKAMQMSARPRAANPRGISNPSDT